MSIHRGKSKAKSPAADRAIAEAMTRVEVEVGKYFPEALDAVKATLAVAAVGCLKDNSQPTTLILVGPPGAGKTLPLSLMMPANDRDPLRAHLYRSDQFTAASFVSHKADCSRESLEEEIDLLPRIKGKTLLTKELAPVFRGKQEELRPRFSVLTSVLDGRGYISDSGAQGRRGYEGKYNFQWVGATTPLSDEAQKFMGQVGPRMVFYEADRAPKSADALAAFLARPNPVRDEECCATAVRQLLRTLYERHPPESIPSRGITITKAQILTLALWAQVLGALRATTGEAREHCERVALILKHVAMGSAIVHGRAAVADYDLAQVRHIALSSGVPNRQTVLRAVLENGGAADTPRIDMMTGLSRPTVLDYMKELDKVDLGRFTKGKPAHLRLWRRFRALATAPALIRKKTKPPTKRSNLKRKGVGGTGDA